MSRRAHFLLLGTATLVLVITAGSGLLKLAERRITIHRVRRVVVERVPLGSHASVVDAFLASDPFQAGSRWEFFPYNAFDRTSEARILSVSWGFMVRTDIEMKFFFDWKKKLVKTRVQEVPFGP